MIDPRTLELLVRHAAPAVDMAALSAPDGSTGVEIMRRAITACLKTLEANHLITVTPQAEWPEFVVSPSWEDVA